MKRIFIIITVAILVLSSCGTAKDLPSPGEIYSKIEETADTSSLFAVSAEYLESNTGITSDLYVEACYFISSYGTSPEELAIIRAKDKESIAKIEEMLSQRLAYIEESSKVYLTEYQPMIQKAVLRVEGLTAILAVSPYSEEISGVIDQLLE